MARIEYHGEPWVLGDFHVAAGDWRHICWLPTEVSRKHNGDAALLTHAARMYEAICELFDAPHQEHFVTRLNEQEYAALERLQRIREMIEETATLPR